MWNPGFAHEAFEPAVLDGWSRALCIYSHPLSRHAGATGPRAGAAERAAAASAGPSASTPEREAEVTAYLDAREMLDVYVYRPRRGCRCACWTAARRSTPGAMSPAPSTSTMPATLDQDAVLACVRQGHGLAGACADYVRNTVAHLREMRIDEPELEGIVDALDAYPASASPSSA